MLCIIEKTIKSLLAALLLFVICKAVFAETTPNQSNITSFLKSGDVIFQLGGFQGFQGRSQHVDIPTLLGDDFSVNDKHDGNVLIGAGYYLTGKVLPAYTVMYGVNLFYLPELEVKGDVTQDNTFTNLSYQYKISHLPLYLVAKGLFHTSYANYDIAVDGGLGPNFMFLKKFREQPLNPNSVPDDPFSDTANVVFSATLGISVRMNDLVKSHPVECGYRFFYLGQGKFDHSVQVSESLDTGTTYANAVICSVAL